MKGTVKFFNDEKGFGFITTEEGKDVFVHNSEFSEDVTLNEGDSVEFEVAQGDRGPKAVKVKKA
jgi:CspA family cold shock protein